MIDLIGCPLHEDMSESSSRIRVADSIPSFSNIAVGGEEMWTTSDRDADGYITVIRACDGLLGHNVAVPHKRGDAVIYVRPPHGDPA
jgi:hypothetical protein